MADPPPPASLQLQASRLTLVQILINSQGLNMNPLQSLYYISPACLACLSVPFREHPPLPQCQTRNLGSRLCASDRRFVRAPRLPLVTTMPASCFLPAAESASWPSSSIATLVRRPCLYLDGPSSGGASAWRCRLTVSTFAAAQCWWRLGP